MSIKKSVNISLAFLMLFSLFPAGQANAAEHKVSMKDWLFNPKVLTVKVGDTVTWVNDDDTMHNIYFEDKFPGAPQIDEPEKIRLRKKFSLTFEKAGEYDYFCRNHQDYDMVGKIIVKSKQGGTP